MANNTFDIFGDAGSIPGEVNTKAGASTKPNFGSTGDAGGEYIPYEPADPNASAKDGPKLEEMFSTEEVERIMAEEAASGSDSDSDIPPGGNDQESFDFSELDAEMLLDVWEDLRINIHNYAYDHKIYTAATAEAKRIIRELSVKDAKTTQETNLMKALWAFVDEHDVLKREYLSAVPYSEKHRALMLKYISYKVEKMKLQGKKFPTWMVPVYLFVLPEVRVLSALMTIQVKMPEFKYRES